MYLLKKIMIAVDIHVFLRCGSISLASDSMLAYLEAQYETLNPHSRVYILENALYLVLPSMREQAVLPDYAVKSWD